MTAEEAPELEPTIAGIIDAYLDASTGFEIDISKLQLRVYLRGPSWSGIVDRPLAKFLLDLDKKITDELAVHGIELPITQHGFVALKIKEGSMDAVLQYAKGIMQEVRKLKPQQQVFILAVLLTALGLPLASGIIDKLEAPQIARIASSERVALVEAVAKVVEASRTRELQQPIRSLVNQMKTDDEIILPGQATPLKRHEAKDSFTKASRAKPETFYIDSRYIVEGLTTKTPDDWEITLKWGEVTFKAKLMVSSPEITELMESFQLAHASGSNIAPDFQVTASINAKGIQSATVVGLGDQRKNSVTIGDAFGKLRAPMLTDSDTE